MNMSFVEHYESHTSVVVPLAISTRCTLLFSSHLHCLQLLIRKVTYQMRPSHLIYRLSIIQLDVEVLVYALEGSADLHFVLEFDRDFVLHERLEEAIV